MSINTREVQCDLPRIFFIRIIYYIFLIHWHQICLLNILFFFYVYVFLIVNQNIYVILVGWILNIILNKHKDGHEYNCTRSNSKVEKKIEYKFWLQVKLNRQVKLRFTFILSWIVEIKSEFVNCSTCSFTETCDEFYVSALMWDANQGLWLCIALEFWLLRCIRILVIVDYTGLTLSLA